MDYKHNRLYGEVFKQLYGVTYTPKVGEIIEQISQLANVGQYSHVNKTLEEDTLDNFTEPQKWIVDLAKSIETRHRDIVLNYLQVPAIATATKEEIKTVTVYFDFRGLMLTVLQDFDSKHKEAGEIVNCIFLGYKPPTDFKEITTTFQVRGGGRKFPMREKGGNDYDGMSVEDYLEIFNLYDPITKEIVETPTINPTPQETSYRPYGPGDIPMLLGNHVSILVQSINEAMYNTLDSFTFGPNGEVKFYTLLNKEGDLPPQVIKALEEIFIKEGWDDAKYSSVCDEGRSTPTKSFTVTMKGKPSE